MSVERVRRWIRGYSRELGTMAVEYSLPDSWTLDRLQRLFGISEEDPMFDCYPIGENEFAALGGSIGQSPDFGQLEFFLEADAEDS